MRSLDVLRWVTVGLLTVALVVPAWLVHLTGSSIVTVAGGSMAPTLERGDVVIIAPIRASELREGMVVTARDSGSHYYTHRIDTIAADGAVSLKGDANEAIDLEARYPTEILGSVRTVLEAPVGTILVQLQLWPLRISVLITILGLALLPLRAMARDRRRASAPRLDPTAEVTP